MWALSLIIYIYIKAHGSYLQEQRPRIFVKNRGMKQEPKEEERNLGEEVMIKGRWLDHILLF